MKLHLIYLLLISIAVIGSYVVGQYVGLYKMQAHAFVLQESLAQVPEPQFESDIERFQNCEQKLKFAHHGILRSYVWYKSHWSSKFPDVSGIDDRTKGIYQLMGKH